MCLIIPNPVQLLNLKVAAMRASWLSRLSLSRNLEMNLRVLTKVHGEHAEQNKPVVKCSFCIFFISRALF